MGRKSDYGLKPDDFGSMHLVDADQACNLVGVLPGDASTGEDDEASMGVSDKLSKPFDIVKDGRTCWSAMREDALNA